MALSFAHKDLPSGLKRGFGQVNLQNPIREFGRQFFFEHPIGKGKSALPTSKSPLLTAKVAVGRGFILGPRTTNCENSRADREIEVLNLDAWEFRSEQKLMIKLKYVNRWVLASVSQPLERHLDAFQELVDFPFQIAKRVIPVLA
jgi:hypothetical protein